MPKIDPNNGFEFMDLEFFDWYNFDKTKMCISIFLTFEFKAHILPLFFHSNTPYFYPTNGVSMKIYNFLHILSFANISKPIQNSFPEIIGLSRQAKTQWFCASLSLTLIKPFQSHREIIYCL